MLFAQTPNHNAPFHPQHTPHVQDLVRAEVEGRVERVAERAAHALENCERERQWPSRRVEAYSPGTFNLSPQLLQAVRKAYHKGPAVC